MLRRDHAQKEIREEYRQDFDLFHGGPFFVKGVGFILSRFGFFLRSPELDRRVSRVFWFGRTRPRGVEAECDGFNSNNKWQKQSLFISSAWTAIGNFRPFRFELLYLKV